jgi:hypothetical protein
VNSVYFFYHNEGVIMRKFCCFCITLTLTVSALAQNATKQPIGTAGNWAGTIAGAALGGKIYTVETGGALYETDSASGTWKQIGKPEFANTLFLFGLGDQLVSIENSGSLYLINPADGSWKPSGKPGDWLNTVAGTVLNGRLYTVEAGGALYETDPASGVWKQVGKRDFADTFMLFAPGDQLVSIEKDGGLYLINPTDGSWKPSGQPTGWANTTAGATLAGKLYTIDAGGTLYKTDPSTGSMQPDGRSDFAGTRFLFPAGSILKGIDGGGSLFAVTTGDAVSPAAAAGAATTSPALDIENDPAVAGQLTFKFMGKWQGDPAPFKEDPEYKKQAEAAPEMVKALVDMMAGMVMSVALDGVTMEVLGQAAGPFKYSVIAGSGNTLVIENDEGPKTGVKSKIVFNDDRHIQVIELTPEGKAMFFKKP